MRCKRSIKFVAVLVFVSTVSTGNAEDVIELDTTRIKGNAELPKYTYIVPWQDKKSQDQSSRKLVLHNLYGDLFDPQMPDFISNESFHLLEPPSEK